MSTKKRITPTLIAPLPWNAGSTDFGCNTPANPILDTRFARVINPPQRPSLLATADYNWMNNLDEWPYYLDQPASPPLEIDFEFDFFLTETPPGSPVDDSIDFYLASTLPGEFQPTQVISIQDISLDQGLLQMKLQEMDLTFTFPIYDIPSFSFFSR